MQPEPVSTRSPASAEEVPDALLVQLANGLERDAEELIAEANAEGVPGTLRCVLARHAKRAGLLAWALMESRQGPTA